MKLVSIISSEVYKSLPKERDSKKSAKALERNSEDGRLLKKVRLLKYFNEQSDRHTKQDQTSAGWSHRDHLFRSL